MDADSVTCVEDAITEGCELVTVTVVAGDRLVVEAACPLVKATVLPERCEDTLEEPGWPVCTDDDTTEPCELVEPAMTADE